MSEDSKDPVEVSANFDADVFDLLQDIAKSLRIDVKQLVENCVMASIVSAAYPKDEARLQYVTAQARIERWRRIQADPSSGKRGW